jgi:phosphate uptake regulator
MRPSDKRLRVIRELLHNLVEAIGDLIGRAVISIDDPSCDLGLEAERGYERMIGLTRILRTEIAVTTARFAPMAGDLRFLLGVSASIPNFERMGDCAKQVCHLASQTSRRGLFPLLSLTQRGAGLSSDVLHQVETAERGVQVESLVAHHEIEEMYEEALGKIELFEPDRRDLETQVLLASKLKEICDTAAKIAAEMAFYQFSNVKLAA